MVDQGNSVTHNKPTGSISVNVPKLQNLCLSLVVASDVAIDRWYMLIEHVGNGDILSFEDYNTKLKQSSVAGTMIAR